jgi:hypothetical protein
LKKVEYKIYFVVVDHGLFCHYRYGLHYCYSHCYFDNYGTVIGGSVGVVGNVIVGSVGRGGNVNKSKDVVEV